MAQVNSLCGRHYFAASYAEARAEFLRSAKSAGGEVASYLKPRLTGPAGEDLAIDAAWFGPADASRLFVSLSGTHGLEFRCGAAGQLQWIDGLHKRPLPADMAVCLVHAVNPFGAAFHTRTTEEHVDLNRNFRDPGTIRRPPTVYEEAKAAIVLPEPSEAGIYRLLDQFDALMRRADGGAVMTAIAGGQDIDPHGPAYGGEALSWEVRILRSLARDRFSQAQAVAIIDWHTGLGPHGVASNLSKLDPHSRAGQLGRKWWGEPAGAGELYDSGNAPPIEGEVRDGLAAEIGRSGAFVVETVFEIGTFDNRALLPAFAIDRWLRIECSDQSTAEAIRMHALMCEWYCPTLPSWRNSALDEMSRLYSVTIEGLSALADSTNSKAHARL